MKNYDFGEGYKASMNLWNNRIILLMYTPTGEYETVHRDEQDAMKEILSYFETDEIAEV